ncbi:MAG: type II toxin-antitoxin system VapC family toxin [Spiribacter salinus]|uniref:Ribonuclease VapC n=1 Tax=Spiribacter salinus TaxID=1335746 RepID=A0A540VR46_9GAMM|nr:MAG: type II toxin-antitoxin system VapC family toxin [Spiribacter salinus]
MYALDTNTLVDFFKGVGDVPARMLATAPSLIGIPAIVAYEIETGIAKSGAPEKRRRQFNELLATTTLLPFDRDAATHSASIRARLEKEGNPVGPLDTLIAGTALAHSAILVTHNTAEFTRIPELQVTDWYTA